MNILVWDWRNALINISQDVYIVFNKWETIALIKEIDKLLSCIPYEESKTYIELKELRYELNKEQERE